MDVAPTDPRTEITDALCDALIFCWLEVKKINSYIRAKHTEKYEQLFRRLLPGSSRTVEKTSDAVESAFHRDEKRTPDGRLPSDAISHPSVL